MKPTEHADLKAKIRDLIADRILLAMEDVFRSLLSERQAEEAIKGMRETVDMGLASKMFEEMIDAIAEETQKE